MEKGNGVQSSEMPIYQNVKEARFCTISATNYCYPGVIFRTIQSVINPLPSQENENHL